MTKTKKCSKCKIDKPLDAYGIDRSTKDGLYPSCKSCRRAHNRTAWAKHSKRHRQRREENKEFIYKILEESECAICGEDDIVLLDFDHINPAEKTANISQMMGWSRKNIEAEVAKCTILCSHCHRYKTAYDNDWYVLKYLKKNNKENLKWKTNIEKLKAIVNYPKKK